ncbi:AaceriAFR385Wp [[Ashbya] aceris (nom. inval.)]|nr:AaceriAFR385Wp [[Ashbya] aceris (nom. inval.)]
MTGECSLSPSFISLIDANGEPIMVYLPETNIENELKFNMLSNLSLDCFSSELYDWTTVPGVPLQHAKFMFDLEGCKVYGQLVPQTGWKYVIGVTDNVPQEVIDNCFQLVRRLVVKCKCNPFVSSQEELVEQLEKAFTREFT